MKSATKLSKIDDFLRYDTKPDPRHYLTKIGYPCLVAVATARKNTSSTHGAGPLIARYKT